MSAVVVNHGAPVCYWVQLEETRSNDNCPTVMCKRVNALCVYALIPKRSRQVNFNH